MFICKRCGYEAAHKCNLRTHLNRKKICSPKDSASDIDVKILLTEIVTITPSKSHECTYCHKKYTTKSILNQHLKKCSSANTPITLTKRDLDDLKASMSSQSAPLINNINNIGTLNDNSNHLHITFNNVNDFKNADYKAVANFFKSIPVKRMIDYVHMHVPDIQPTLFNELLYNLKHKENITLAVPDPSKNEALYFNNGQWEKTDDAKDFINDILLVNATQVKEANYSLPKDLRRDSNELNPLFDTRTVLPKIITQAHNNMHIVEEVHGPISEI